MGILTYIRQKTDKEKKLLSLVLAAILTLFITLACFPFIAGSDKKQSDVSNNKLSSVSPIQMIKDEFSKAFSAFGESSSTTPSIPIEIVNEVGDKQEQVGTTTSTSTPILQSTSTPISPRSRINRRII
jgi:hypothetical protein